MSQFDDGGLVYPMPDWDLRDHSWTLGITRRDWLAGLAMQGLLVTENAWTEETIAKVAYEMADAMIAQGKKEGDQ